MIISALIYNVSNHYQIWWFFQIIPLFCNCCHVTWDNGLWVATVTKYSPVRRATYFGHLFEWGCNLWHIILTDSVDGILNTDCVIYFWKCPSFMVCIALDCMTQSLRSWQWKIWEELRQKQCNTSALLICYINYFQVTI